VSGLWLAVAGQVNAQTCYVARAGQTPGEPYDGWGNAASNIQTAVDYAAANGYDEVVVSNGTYAATQLVVHAAITVRSFEGDLSGAANTIIERDTTLGNFRVVLLTPGAVLEGFTVRKGEFGYVQPDSRGGGILMTNATVRHCIVTGNKLNGLSNRATYGAGIYADGGLIDGCVVTGNLSYSMAGGIYAGGAVVSNCVVAGNTVTYYDGGGIMLAKGGMAVSCVVTNNTAKRWGGGVASRDAGYTATIRNCQVAGNSTAGKASEGGGGVSPQSGALIVENCTIAGNTVTDLSGVGGGVWVRAGATAALTNTIVYFNTAASSADIANAGTFSAGYSCSPALVDGENGNKTADPEFAAYEGSAYGLGPESPCANAGTNLAWTTAAGAVDLAGNPRNMAAVVDMGAYELQVSGAEFGCSFSGEPVTGTNSLQVVFTASLTGSEAQTNNAWYGWDFTNGGTYGQSGTNLVTVTNLYPEPGRYTVRLVASNALGEVTNRIRTDYITVYAPIAHVSTNGLPQWPYAAWATAAANIQDALDVGGNTPVLVTNGTYRVTSTLAMAGGAVLRSVNGAVHTIIERDASAGSFRVLEMDPDSELDGFTVRNGSLNYENGAGVHMTLATVRNCVVTGNSLGGLANRPASGAGIYAIGGLIADSVMTGNSAYTHGGGIYMTDAGLVSNCTVTANATTRYDGGGIALVNGATATHCVVTNNTANRWGGGVALSGSGYTATLRDGLVADNRATGADGQGGGGVSAYNTGAAIENCTITSNHVTHLTGSGGGIWSTATASVMLTNSIVYFNAATTLSDIDCEGAFAPGYSCSPGLTPGVSGNIVGDPLFTDAAAGDYTLSKPSPCKEAGTNLTWMLTATDLAGEPRIRGKRVDMGAYEAEYTAPGTVVIIR
jgi:predicted outer membrane repeat protein